MQYCPIDVTFTAHCVGCTFFGQEGPGYLHSSDWLSSLVHMSEPRFHPQRRFVQEIRHLPFGTGPTRPVQMLSGAIVAPRKFHGISNALQVCSIAECGLQFCDILRLVLLTHAQSIGNQHPTGKQGVELPCCWGLRHFLTSQVISIASDIKLN